MRKILFLSSLFIAFQAFNVDGYELTNENYDVLKTALKRCIPACPRGPTGVTGPAGATGPTGPTGAAGGGLPFEINDILEVTSTLDLTFDDPALVTFESPIVTPTNGIDIPSAGGMTLVESVPASGNFDTITLPFETSDTFYLVSFGTSQSVESQGDFGLVLNGVQLPYTILTVGFNTPQALISKTSVIVNPANIAGTLNLSILSAFTTLSPPPNTNISAYVSVVKLNNNAP